MEKFGKLVDKAFLPRSEEKQQEFLQFLSKQIKSHPVVKEHHGKWKELIAWTDEGKQFAEYDTDSNAMKAVPLRRRKLKIVVNLMKPLAEAFDSKINTNFKAVGVPNSSELGDIMAAQVSTKLLAFNNQVNQTDRLWEDFKYDLTRTGNAFLKCTFEKGKFGHIKGEADKTGKFEKIKAEGEVTESVPSVFNLRPDPAGKSRKDWRWFIELVEMTDDDIVDIFEVDETRLKSAPQESGSKYEGMNEPEQEKDKEINTHIVMLYWEIPSKTYPNGRHIIATDNLYLFANENEGAFSGDDGGIPFFSLGYHRRGNSMWHFGPLHHIQPIQRAFNRTNSMIAEHIESWKPKLIAPKGAIKQGAFTTDFAEILETMPSVGGPITPLNTPALGSDVYGQRDFLRSMIPEVSNVHEVSYARLPQYATRAPASLYSLMLEQENIKFDPLLVRWNAMIIDEAKYKLRLMEKFYKQARLVKVVGKNNEVSIQWFKGADIAGNYDIRLEIGVSVHQSKSIMQRMILELKEAGVVTDNNKIIRLLQMGDIEEELRGDIVDTQRAQRENQAFVSDAYKKDFEKGGVKMWMHDDHDLHLQWHTNLWKTEEAQGWKEEKRVALEGHIMEHLKFIMMLKQAEQMAQQTQQAQGQPKAQAGAAQSAGAAEQAGGAGGGMGQTMPTPEVSQQRALTAT